MFNSHTYPDNRDSLVFQIDSLKSSLELKDSTINSLRKQLNELRIRIDSVKNYISSMHELGEEVSDDLISIAELLDISLTRQYAVEIHVVYRGNIEMPLDAEINDIEDHIEFSFSDRGADDWEVDIFQYDLSIDAEEA